MAGRVETVDLSPKLAELPDRPGVYLYKDAKSQIIYVGKAASLRSRVRSYFSSDTRRKVAAYSRLAFIDESLRGDVASARMSYDSIAELDQSSQDAARRLERALIG